MKPRRAISAEARLSAVIGASSDIDPIVREVLERVARIISRCGIHPTQIDRLTSKICRQIPASLLKEGTSIEFSYEDASHILTLWSTDPRYLDQSAKPILLPARGPTLSVEALLRAVNPTLDVEGSIEYLIRVRGLRKEGDLYGIAKRVVIYHGLRDPTYARNLHVLRGVLRTLEHNIKTKLLANGLVERVATNPGFPVRQLRAFKNKVLVPQAQQFLETVDDAMQRRADSSAEDDPKTRLYCGVYVFTDPVKRATARRTKKTDTRSIRLAKSKPPRGRKDNEVPADPGDLVGRLDDLIRLPKSPRS